MEQFIGYPTVKDSKHVEAIFSTNSVHRRDRFDYWHSVACKQIVGHDSLPENRLTFEAQISAAKFGDLDIVEFENSPMRVAHTLAQVDRSSPDIMFICYQLSGSTFVVQNGCEVRINASSMMLLDPRLPYEAGFGSASKMLLIKAPRRELNARIGRNRELIGCCVKAGLPDDDLALSMLATLPSLTGKTTEITQQVLSNYVLDLVGLSVARTKGRAIVGISNSKALILGQVRSVVEARLTDPDLNAQKVAKIVGTSVRYANSILAEQGCSLHRLIQSRRLVRCRSALEDPGQSQRTIAEIARGWGFTDMTHFGRCFKAAYTLSPRDYRKAAETSLERS